MNDSDISLARRQVLGGPEARGLIDRFEEALFAGANPRIEDAVPVDLPDRRVVLEELVHAEIECRGKRNESASLDDYLIRFPELADDPESISRLEDTIRQYSPSDSAPLNGSPAGRFFGDYELLHEIARGGMGVVYKARQLTLNRIVAVKMILSGQLASPADVRRFHTEAEAAAKLDHPAIVPIYEVGQQGGQHYFSMGFVDGQSLAKRVAEGPLPPRAAADMVCKIAEAVQYAHARGVVHRDLKPGNILLDGQENPRVTDFGLAKVAEGGSDLTGTGQVLGTPCYMPPEQASPGARDVGRLSDVYSLGAILYCLLTGRPPFQAATSVETLIQVQSQEPLSVRQLNPGIPPDLDTIVLKCLEKIPARRYSSAGELSAELRRFSEGRPILARPVGRVERFWRWTRREPVVARLAMALLLFLVVATIGSLIAAGSFRAISKTARDAEISARKSEIFARTEESLATQTMLETRRELAHALISEARMLRRSSRVGRYSQALVKIREVQGIFRELEAKDQGIEAKAWDELRDEAASTFLAPDLLLSHQLPRGTVSTVVGADVAHERYLGFDRPAAKVPVRRMGDDRELFSVESPNRETFNNGGFSYCGNYLWLQSSSSGDIHMWNAGEKSAAYLRKFSPGGSRVIVAGEDPVLALGTSGGSTQFYRLADGALIQSTSAGELPELGNALHPHKPWVALVMGRKLRVFDFKSPRIVWETSVPGNSVRNAGWSHDGRWLSVSTRDCHIATYAGESGRLLHAALVDNDHGGVDPIPLDPHNMFAIRNWSETLKLYDIRTGWQMLTGSRSADFPRDPLQRPGDSSRFLVDHDFEFRLLQPRRGRLTAFAEDADHVCCLSRSGQLVAVARAGVPGVRLFHVPSGEHVVTLPAELGSRPLAFEPNDQALLVYGFGLYRIPLELTAGPRPCLRIGAARKMIDDTTLDGWGASSECTVIAASANNLGATIYRQSAEDSTQWKTIRTPPQRDVRHVQVSPDGKWIFAASHVVGNVSVYSAETGQLVKDFPGLHGCVWVSPDGNWLVAQNQLVRVAGWEICGARPGPGNVALNIAFSDDSRMLASADGMGAIGLYETATLRRIVRLEIPDEAHVYPHYFTPDGTGLIAKTSERKRLLYFDLAGLREDLARIDLDWNWPAFPPDRSMPAEDSGISRVVFTEFDEPEGEATAFLDQFLPAISPAWVERAETLIRGDDLAKAAAAYRRVFELNSADFVLGRWWATLSLAAGDSQEYRRACQLLRQRLDDSTEYFNAAHLAWTLMLSPAESDDGLLLELATRLVNIHPKVTWNQTGLAAAQIRKGDCELGLKSLDISDQLGTNWRSRVVNDFLRGIALLRRGQIADAQSIINSAGQWCDLHLKRTPEAPFGDCDWFAIRIFRREAEDLLRQADSPSGNQK